jgi:hypothetical protein
MFLRRCSSNHRIAAAAGKRMTAQDAEDSHPSTSHCTIALDGLHRIFGAGRQVSAGPRQQGRDGPLVSTQQVQRDESGALIQDRLPLSGFRVSGLLTVASAGGFSRNFDDKFCSITAKARLTSLSTTEKSVTNNDFFGLITTSAATPQGGEDKRTASRKRRFMRLRCTAPPSARPTVNPTRSPCDADLR